MKKQMNKQWKKALIAASIALVLLSSTIYCDAKTRAVATQGREGAEAKAGEAVAFDLQAIRKAVVGRIEIGADQLRAATVHTPPGTAAYLAGRLDEAQPAVLAWYNTETKQLVAGVELRVAHNVTTTKEGVEINAGANENGKAPALVTINSKQSVPALLRPKGLVTLRASGDSKRYAVAPLLSFEGSSHLLSLAQPVANNFLQSKRFDVQVQNASGATVFSQNGLGVSGCIPVNVHVGTTTTNRPKPVEVTNPGDFDQLVSLRPRTPNVKWSDTGGQETRTVKVPRGGTVSPGSLVSQIPGEFPLAYHEQPISTPDDRGFSKIGDWANGPVPVDHGSATLGGLSDSPTTNVTTRNPNTSASLLTTPNSSHSVAIALAVAGTAAGAVAILLTNDKGESHEQTVSFTPVSQDGLDENPNVVRIEAVPEELSDALASVPVESAHGTGTIDLGFVQRFPNAPVPATQDEEKCTHDGKIAIGGKRDKEKAGVGDPEYRVKEGKGELHAHVEAYAETEGCCCLDRVRVSLKLHVRYKRWYWHKVQVVTAKPGERKAGSLGGGGQRPVAEWKYEWKADDQEQAREVDILIKEDDQPPCHFWKFDEDVDLPWDKIAEAFLTANKGEKNWPPEGVQFEVTDNTRVQAVLQYKVKPEKEGGKCQTPEGWQTRHSDLKEMKRIGGAKFQRIGEKPEQPE